MTRTPRLTDRPHEHATALRGLTTGLRGRAASLGGKTLAVLAAALAIVVAGAVAVMAVSTGSTARSATVTHGARGSHGLAARPGARHQGAGRAAHASSWKQVARIAAERTYPKAGNGPLPAADRLTPAGTSGPQAWLPITSSRWHNARAIVRQALARHMGLRAAVIAVATAMQESGLVDIGYGTSDSLGLFQQRPSMGWGTPAQVLRPAYAADAFLGALRTYQATDPGWAHQPLWQTAQGVQKSGFPYAYAKWETQAAHLVRSITRHLI